MCLCFFIFRCFHVCAPSSALVSFRARCVCAGEGAGLEREFKETLLFSSPPPPQSSSFWVWLEERWLRAQQRRPLLFPSLSPQIPLTCFRLPFLVLVWEGAGATIAAVYAQGGGVGLERDLKKGLLFSSPPPSLVSGPCSVAWRRKWVWRSLNSCGDARRL